MIRFLLQTSPRRCISPGPGDKLRGLEERLRKGETEALMAEERARLKKSVMTEKMKEMNKLQTTLSEQNHVRFYGRVSQSIFNAACVCVCLYVCLCLPVSVDKFSSNE